MKIIILIVTILLFVGCSGGVIGSEDNETINDVEWTLNEYTFSNTTLTATGMITNTGATTILATWWVEAEFYSDSTFSIVFFIFN